MGVAGASPVVFDISLPSRQLFPKSPTPFSRYSARTVIQQQVIDLVWEEGKRKMVGLKST
jgi:hypothetical protein